MAAENKNRYFRFSYLKNKYKKSTKHFVNFAFDLEKNSFLKLW